MNAMPLEIGLSIVDPRRLAALAGHVANAANSVNTAPTRVALLDFLGDPELGELLPADARLSHLYFGSEYCEHLFPDDAALTAAVRLAERCSLRLVLATPIACDAVVARLAEAAPLLPAGSEVVVNDWGMAAWLRAHAPQLTPVAGRQLSKMIKDPRLPGAQWMKVYPSNYAAAGHAALLGRLGIARVELDVPPFATPEVFAVDGLGVTVWAPYAYIAKGRICKVGSLRQPLAEKFAPGRPCRHECLGLLEAEPEGGAPRGAGLRTYSRGTTMFYRHDAAMRAVVRAAVDRRLVSRLVLSEV
ncbi:MAG: hypothetical protein HYU78_17465 [Rhodocyclales bacterium]|nr:hypothetical protein [Rhodocyclales bacterium]